MTLDEKNALFRRTNKKEEAKNIPAIMRFVCLTTLTESRALAIKLISLFWASSAGPTKTKDKEIRCNIKMQILSRSFDNINEHTHRCRHRCDTLFRQQFDDFVPVRIIVYDHFFFAFYSNICRFIFTLIKMWDFAFFLLSSGLKWQIDQLLRKCFCRYIKALTMLSRRLFWSKFNKFMQIS